MLDGFNYFISVYNTLNSPRLEAVGIELNLTHISFNAVPRRFPFEFPGEGIYGWLSTNVTHDLDLFIVSGSTDQFLLASPERRVYKNKVP